MAQTFILKNLSFSYNSISDTLNRVIIDCYLDANNYYILRKTNDNKFTFEKVVSGISTLMQSSQQTFSKWQSFNIIITIDENYGTKMHILKNNNDNKMETISSSDKSILHGNANIYLHNVDGTGQINGFIESFYYHPVSYYNKDEICKEILSGIDRDFKDIELITDLINPFQTIQVFPNNVYKLEMDIEKSITVEEYYNDIKLREINTNKNIKLKVLPYTNNIKLISNDNLMNVSFKLDNNVENLKIGTFKVGTEKIGYVVT